MRIIITRTICETKKKRENCVFPSYSCTKNSFERKLFEFSDIFPSLFLIGIFPLHLIWFQFVGCRLPHLCSAFERNWNSYLIKHRFHSIFFFILLNPDEHWTPTLDLQTALDIEFEDTNSTAHQRWHQRNTEEKHEMKKDSLCIDYYVVIWMLSSRKETFFPRASNVVRTANFHPLVRITNILNFFEKLMIQMHQNLFSRSD